MSVCHQPELFLGVRRFPQQANILSFLQDYVTTSVPIYDVVSSDCVSYRLLQGQGLHYQEYLRLSQRDQEVFAASLACFLRELRSIPLDVPRSHGIAEGRITKSPEEYRSLGIVVCKSIDITQNDCNTVGRDGATRE